MTLFDMTYYTTNLKLILKYLKRKKNLRCIHIRELPYYDRRFVRYVLLCKDTEGKDVSVEVFEYRE